MDGEVISFTGRGGAGRGKPKIYGARVAGNPPISPQCGAGRGREGVKIYRAGRGWGPSGAGNILRVLIEIICCSKEISICIALSEVRVA